MNMTTYAERLQYAMNNRDKERKDIALAVGVSVQAVGKLLNSPKGAFTAENNSIVAKYLKINPDWLATGEGEMDLYADGLKTHLISAEITPEYIHAVPLLNAHGSMGPGSYPNESEYAIAKIELTDEWIRRELPTITSPENLSLVTGLGDSMYPTYKNGETLFVDVGFSQIDIDAVFMFMYRGEVYIKRVQRIPDGLLIISDNTKYKEFTIPRENYHEIKVFGRINGALEYKGF